MAEHKDLALRLEGLEQELNGLRDALIDMKKELHELTNFILTQITLETMI